MPADERNNVDAPHPVVIELTQEITCKEAQELGKVLGAAGYTGVFVGGTVAQLCALGAEYKRQQSRTSRDQKQGA